MTDRFSEDDVIASISILTRQRLHAFVDAQIVAPVHSEGGLYYRRVDVARLELLCELTDDFELSEDGASIVMSLIDQLHTTRRDLDAFLRAVEGEDPEICRRICERVIQVRQS